MGDDLTAKSSETNLLALDAPERVVTWLDRPTQRVRRFVFRPVTKAAARKFYQDLNPQSATGSARILAAHDNLFFALIERAEGYRVRGGGELVSLPDWKRLVPDGDRRLAVTLLQDARAHQGEELPDIDPGFDTAVLDARWNPVSGAQPGEHQWYFGLVHRLERMTVEEDAEFREELTQGRLVGGSRSGATLRPVRELVLLAWYDKKIAAVEGYSVGSRGLESPEEIRRWMDPFHKIAAMQQVRALVPDAEISPAPGEEETEDE